MIRTTTERRRIISSALALWVYAVLSIFSICIAAEPVATAKNTARETATSAAQSSSQRLDRHQQKTAEPAGAVHHLEGFQT